MNARLTALESDLRSGDLSVGLWDLLGKNFMTAATCPKNMRGTCRKVLSTRVRIKGLERRRDTTMAQKVAKKDRMEVRSAEARVNHDNSSADYEAKKALYNACLSAS